MDLHAALSFMSVEGTVIGCGGHRHMMHIQWRRCGSGQVEVSGLWLWLGDGRRERLSILTGSPMVLGHQAQAFQRNK